MRILPCVAFAATALCATTGIFAEEVKFYDIGKFSGLPNLSDPGLEQATAPIAHAAPQTQTFNYGFTLNQSIPDNDPSGVVDHRELIGVGYIKEIEFTLQISGGANGDYYVYLQHDNAVAVLLNRVGKSDTLPEGYNEPGFNVTFSDAASNGDIHIYRVTIAGNENTPLGEPLGSQLGDSLWQPDGRNVSPLEVTTDSARTATLSAFNDHLLAGGWTLFAADMSPGQQGVLVGWNMQVVVVPEPTVTTLFLLSLLAVGAGIRHRRTKA